MFKIIEGLEGVMAIKATGNVTHEDYRDTLILNIHQSLTGGCWDARVLDRPFCGAVGSSFYAASFSC